MIFIYVPNSKQKAIKRNKLYASERQRTAGKYDTNLNENNMNNNT